MEPTRHCPLTWIVSVAVLVELLVDPVRLVDLPGVSVREPWRFFTAHLCHGSLTHALLCVVVFVPLARAREHAVGSFRIAVELGVICLCVSLGVRVFHPYWPGYRGLSGVVYGLVPLACSSALRTRDRLSWGLVLVVLVKCAAEYYHGGWLWMPESLDQELGVRFMPGSHLAGLTAGGLLCLIPAPSTDSNSFSVRKIRHEGSSGR